MLRRARGAQGTPGARTARRPAGEVPCPRARMAARAKRSRGRGARPADPAAELDCSAPAACAESLVRALRASRFHRVREALASMRPEAAFLASVLEHIAERRGALPTEGERALL